MRTAESNCPCLVFLTAMMKRSEGSSRPSLSLKKRKKILEEEEIENKIEEPSDTKQQEDLAEKEGRFSFVSSDTVTTNQAKIVPQNTEKCTQWAVKVFKDWLVSQSKHSKEVPSRDVLLSDDKEAI